MPAKLAFRQRRIIQNSTPGRCPRLHFCQALSWVRPVHARDALRIAGLETDRVSVAGQRYVRPSSKRLSIRITPRSWSASPRWLTIGNISLLATADALSAPIGLRQPRRFQAGLIRRQFGLILRRQCVHEPTLIATVLRHRSRYSSLQRLGEHHSDSTSQSGRQGRNANCRLRPASLRRRTTADQSPAAWRRSRSEIS